MFSILIEKGTWVKNSAPNNASDDYMALHVWKSKQDFRAKYDMKDEWVLPFDII